MTDLERTNLERPRINSNTTSNNPERITQIKWIFLQLYGKRNENKPTNYRTKQKTLRMKKTYNTTKWIEKKKGYVTLNKYDS